MDKAVRITKTLPDKAWLRARFAYNPSTGILRWKTRPLEDFGAEWTQRRWNNRYAGNAAGGPTASGHWTVAIFNRKWLLHRVIWKWMTGEEPPPQIDHRDENPANNRWRNLRAATDVQNKGNARVHRDSTTGIKGVQFSPTKGRFTASMSQNKRKVHLGTFATKEEAHQAYCKAASDYFGEFWSPGTASRTSEVSR